MIFSNTVWIGSLLEGSWRDGGCLCFVVSTASASVPYKESVLAQSMTNQVPDLRHEISDFTVD